MSLKLEDIFESLSIMVHEHIGINLFKEIPFSEIESLSYNVDNEDSLRARITDACNIFDRINKKEIDRYLGTVTNGSKGTFINLMKYICKDEHVLINDEIEKPLSLLFLLRGYLVHRRNRNINKALDYFQLSLPLSDFQDTWNKVHAVLRQLLQLAKNAIQKQVEKKCFSQVEIDADLQDILSRKMLESKVCFLDDIGLKPIVLLLMVSGPLSDIELAQQLRLDVFNLREMLIDLVPHIVEVKYRDMVSTELQIRDHAIPVLKEYYFGKENK